MRDIRIVVTMDYEWPVSDTHAAASVPPSLEKAVV